MKRIFAASMLAALALGLAPAHAEDASGAIQVPTLGNSRLQRCQDVHGAPNGTFGYVVDVTGGASFALTADGDPAIDDFDISFYRSVNACAEDADVTETEHPNVEGNEAGTVPEGANEAIITLYVGTPGAGFSYTE